MKKNQLYVMLLSASMLTFNSCSDYPGYKKTDTGLYYKFYVQNEGNQKPEMGDVLTVNMMYKVQGKDSVIFNSKDVQEPSRLLLSKPVYAGDISEGLAMMALGDSASFIISADSFYRKNVGIEKMPPFVKPGSKLVFDVKVKSIQKKADYEKEQKLRMENVSAMMKERKAKEPEDIKTYIKDNKIYTKPTVSGLYYIETKRGTGAKAENGKTVTISYTGKLLDGSVFDSSEGKTPIAFVLGSKQVIPGWEEGISLMRVGGKAKLLIPSVLAYGQNGAGQVIMPYSPLVFDVELIDVK
ncbi:MAG: FKBP-type peptidyl-prolyl cis-trans isomerase [Bacteroidales bacterium]